MAVELSDEARAPGTPQWSTYSNYCDYAATQKDIMGPIRGLRVFHTQ